VIKPGREDDVTARAGLALVVEAGRAVGVDTAVGTHLSLRERRSGYSEAEKVEAVVQAAATNTKATLDLDATIIHRVA
jgi:hypothetical protein